MIQTMHQYPTPQEIVEKLPTMLWVAGPDAYGHWFNDAWLEFRGRSREDELEGGWHEGIHPDDIESFRTTYRERFEARDPFETLIRLRRSDSDYRRVQVKASPYEDADPPVFIGTCTDIETILERENEVSTFFDMSPDLICVAGFDGYFKHVSQSWVDTLGWSRVELQSRPILEFVHPMDRPSVINARSQLKSDAQMEPLVNRYRCKDGTYRRLEWRSVAVPARRRVYASARVVPEVDRSPQERSRSTERAEALDRQFSFTDRMASVGTLAAGVAHEVNNPLAYVLGNLSILAEHLQGPKTDDTDVDWELLVEMVEDATDGATRIQKIVKGLQTFSKVDEQELTTFDVGPIVDEAIDIAENQIRHRAQVARDHGAVSRVHADKTRLRQVIVDLLLNAAQAIPEGEAHDNEVRVTTYTDADGRAVIEVRDTGVGIPEAHLDRIFDPFFTTKPIGVGTGLGLSVCHNFIDGFGGDLTVDTEEGVGSTFRIALPQARAADLTADTEAEPKPEPDHDSLRASVLVIDDEPAVGRFIKRALTEHDVTWVETAREALASLEHGDEFQLIVADVMLPEMSSERFHDHLQKAYPAYAERVVFLSGGAFTDEAKQFVADVPNDVLDKPISPERLRAIASRFARLFA